MTAHPHYRSKVGKSLREAVRRRDKERCHLCRESVAIGQGAVDHLTPVKSGGSTLLSNSAWSHKTCNEFRGARPLTAELKAECRTRYLDLTQ
jgi:5-methylcytosine-specific restriction endonuclease McrA